MTLRMSRDQCMVTLELAGVRHVYCSAGRFTGYAMQKGDYVWKPTYTAGRRHRRLATFTEVGLPQGRVAEQEGWAGWRIDELRMAVQQLVVGVRDGPR